MWLITLYRTDGTENKFVGQTWAEDFDEIQVIVNLLSGAEYELKIDLHSPKQYSDSQKNRETENWGKE
jgi:hypothetical protein